MGILFTTNNFSNDQLIEKIKYKSKYNCRLGPVYVYNDDETKGYSRQNYEYLVLRNKDKCTFIDYISDNKNKLQSKYIIKNVAYIHNEFSMNIKYFGKYKYLIEYYAITIDEIHTHIILKFELTHNILSNIIYENNIKFDIMMKLKIIKNIADAIKFLHDKDIVHKNIKLEHIFICENNGNITAKLGGYGIQNYLDSLCMNFLNSDENNENYLHLENIINIRYSAPGIFLDIRNLRKINYTKKSDNYSFGIIVNEIINEKKPYCEYTNNEYIDDVIIKKKRPRIFIPIDDYELKLRNAIIGYNIDYNNCCCDLYDKNYYLAHDPNNRFDIDVILNILHDIY